MAKDAEIKLILNTSEFLKQAKAVGPELQKALDVKTVLPGIEQYQTALAQMVKDKDALNKQGKLKGAFDPKQLEQYEAKFKELFGLADKWKQVNENLEKLGVKSGEEDKGLSSLRGKIGGAVKKGGTGDDERAAYNEAKKLVEQKAALEAVITTEYNKQKDAFDKMANKVNTVHTAEEEHKDAITAINEKYAEVADLANKELSATEQSAEAKSDVVSEQDGITEATKADISATKEDIAATEQLADAKSKVAEQGVVAEEKTPISETPSTDATETTKQGAEETNQSIKDLMVTLNGYREELQALQSTGKATADVEEKIANTADKIKERMTAALNFDAANASYTDLLNHAKDLREIEQAFRNMKIPPELASQFEAVRAEIVRTKESVRDYEDRFKNISIGEGFAKVKTTISKVTSGIRTGFQTAQRVVTKAVRVMRSAVSGFVKIVKTGFSTISKAVNKVKSHFDKMSHSMRSNFKQMITSLTKYILGFRSLFFLVRRLRKYIGEGIENMAQFNNAVNPVNTNITKLLSSLLYLKNAWATAFSPILNFITPWLSALIDKLAEAGNAFSRFLGNLLGGGKVFQAVKVKAADYGKGLQQAGGSAGKAAKKQKQLNDRLAAFDDLNVLGKDKDKDTTGNGGGGGGNDQYKPDPNKMFKIVNVGDNLAKKLKDMWAKADFSDLGKTISDKLVKALNSIKWDKIQVTALKIGKSIATFLNGAFKDKKIWESVGNALAQGVNTLTKLLYGFLANDKTDWGGGLATLINKFFENTDWTGIKNNIKIFTDKLIQNINSFLQGLDKDKIGEGVSSLSEGITYFISNAISGIKWGELAGIFSSVGGAIIDGIISGLSQSENPFLSAIGGLLGSIKGAFEQGDATVAADGLTTFIKNLFANVSVEDILKAAQDFFGRLFSNILSAISIGDGTGVFGDLMESFKMVATTLMNIFTAVMNILPQMMPGILMITEASMNLFNALLPIIEAVLPVLNQLIAYFTSIVGSILVPVLQLLTPIIQFICSVLDLIMPVFDDIVGLITETLGNVTPLLGPLTELLQAILTPISAILQPIMKILGIIIDLVIDLLSPIMDLIAPLIEMLVECFRPILSVITLIGDFIGAILVPVFKVFADIIRLIVIPIIKSVIGVFSLLGEGFKKAGELFNSFVDIFRLGFNEIKKFAVSGANFIAGKIEWLLNAFINGVNKGIRAINKIKIDVPDWVPAIGGSKFGFQLKEMQTITIPRLAQGAVIPPNREFMAVLGDQSHGTNVEAPLDTIKQAVAEVLANNGNAEVIQLLQQLIGVVERKNLTIGDKEIAKANARYTNQQRIIRGASF